MTPFVRISGVAVIKGGLSNACAGPRRIQAGQHAPVEGARGLMPCRVCRGSMPL